MRKIPNINFGHTHAPIYMKICIYTGIFTLQPHTHTALENKRLIQKEQFNKGAVGGVGTDKKDKEKKEEEEKEEEL